MMENKKLVEKLAKCEERCRAKSQAVVTLAIQALLTDGEHHKQWYLEEIIKSVGGEEGLKNVKEECLKDSDFGEWEPGIAP